MLQITPTQMQALQQDARQGALGRLAAYLADVFPERREPWDKIAEQGLEDAGAYGVQHEREVGLFLVLQVEWGRGFEDLPPFAWAKAVLMRDDLDGRIKMERVHKGLTEGPNTIEPVYEED